MMVGNSLAQNFMHRSSFSVVAADRKEESRRIIQNNLTLGIITFSSVGSRLLETVVIPVFKENDVVMDFLLMAKR